MWRHDLPRRTCLTDPGSNLAISARRLAQETQISQEQPDLGMVRIRAGIHTGPATAAVIGARTKKFSVFGDTVNTAARMESLSHPLCIQMTEAAAKVLQSADPDGLAKGLKARGKIKVKGKVRERRGAHAGGAEDERDTLRDSGNSQPAYQAAQHSARPPSCVQVTSCQGLTPLTLSPSQGTMPTYWLLYEGCPDPAEVAPRSSQAGRHHKKSQDGDVAAAIRKAVDGNRSVSLARAPRNAGVQRAPTISMVRGWKAPSIPRTPRSNPAAGHAESSAAAAGQGAPQGDGVAGGVKGRGVAPGLKPVWESDEGGNESEEVEVDGEGVSAPAKRKPTRLMQASYAQEDGDDGKEANGRDA